MRGSSRERRIERAIALLFLIAGLAGIAFLVVYIAWPFTYEPGHNQASGSPRCSG